MLVAQLRCAYGSHVGEPAWTKFVRRLQGASPEFSKLWAQHEVASPSSYLKIFRHPAHDRLVMTTTSFAVNAAPGSRMVVYVPADQATSAAVASLIAGDGADARYECWAEHYGSQEAAGTTTAYPADGPGPSSAAALAYPVRHGHRSGWGRREPADRHPHHRWQARRP